MLTVGVVVPAHQAEKELPACLAGLLGADFSPAEIIVVDDGSKDATGAVARAMGITCIRNETALGPAEARNRGALHATADLLVFVDADVVVHRGGRARIVDAFQGDVSLDALFGSYDDAPPAPAAVSRYRNLLHHFVHQRSNADAGTFWTGYGAVRREVFQRLGGLRRAWQNIEDVEFGMRLKRSGGRIRLDRNLLATHLKAWTVGSMFRTDLKGRAIPWTKLLMSGYPGGDLNLTGSHKICAATVVLGLGALPVTAFLPVLGLGMLAMAIVGFVAANWDFLSLLRRRNGFAFAAQALPFHVLHYLAAVIGFAWTRATYSPHPAPSGTEMAA